MSPDRNLPGAVPGGGGMRDGSLARPLEVVVGIEQLEEGGHTCVPPLQCWLVLPPLELKLGGLLEVSGEPCPPCC